MTLTTLNAVKDQAGIPRADTTRDNQIKAFICGISDYVTRFLGRNIEQQEYTEYYSGDGTVELLLRQYPVISVQRVCVDSGGYFGDPANAFPSANDLVSGVDYALVAGQWGKGSSGILRRIGGSWAAWPARVAGTVQSLPSKAQGNILVEYTAGYAEIPPALVMAVNSLVAKGIFQSQFGGGVQSASYEDASASFAASDEVAKTIGSVTSTLGLFRSIVI
ncbi:hypothetical protein [Schlesneria sp. T3-172]|uniref:hypothetical protein n=1 Tax=Schlesneria sphaerica TaxID=3373610 RepID=UPI0037CA30AF